MAYHRHQLNRLIREGKLSDDDIAEIRYEVEQGEREDNYEPPEGDDDYED